LILDHAHVAKQKLAPDPELGRALREAMASHPELNKQAALARKAGVSQSTISRMRRGEVNPQSDNVRRVAEALGIPVSRLLDPTATDGPGSFSAEVATRAKGLRMVPIVSLVPAGGFGETVDPYPPGDGSGRLLCPVNCGPGTFALKVQGESMEPRYHDGDMIFVGPDISAVHGSDVIVRLENEQEATFKQLAIDGSRRYLKPLNTRYPVIEITTEAKIVGVVIAATWSKTRVPAP
jgi:SOS-response transcriptional repressor LexA